ncbi:MAG: archaea-specific SMC-related protein [Halodesulfurarchaeum sp.]
MDQEHGQVHARLSCQNIGGIDETEVTIPPGVTVLSGRNATNRSSLLQAIMAAMGSREVSLKADAEEGHVELELDGETYTRELTRTSGGVVFDGDPYLEDTAAADRFAFLLEGNEARRAVTTGGDLRDVIMAPVDTAAIEAEISQYEARKRQLDERLEELETVEREVANRETRREELRAKIESKREELEETEAAIQAADRSIEGEGEGAESDRSELESQFDELQAVRSDLEDVRFQIDTQEESIEALEDEREEAMAELSELEGAVQESRDLDTRIEELRNERAELESEIADLRAVISFNREQLEADGALVPDGLGNVVEGGDGRDRSDGEASVTDELVASETTCWTCGSVVPTAQIESTVETLQNVLQSKLEERNEIDAELGELTDRRDEREQTRRRRAELEERVAEIDDELETRSQRLEELRSERAELEETLESIEEAIDAAEEAGTEDETILELHREANTLEVEIERLESELEDVEEALAEGQERLANRDDLKETREEVDEHLRSLRNRVEDLETGAVEAFNEHMETILELLDYDNLDRIWIERKAGEGTGSDRAGNFELHVIRSTPDGSAYEDTADHLSESEREVTGLIFALAGYLVHDVAAECPFMLLDSLEAIDAARISRLVEYVSAYADFLVVALLEEDAEAIEVTHETISDI